MKFERSDEDVGNRVFKGVLFLTGARLILRLFSLVNLVVLGRYLDASDYGIASLALVVMGVTQVLSDMRINSGLISMRDITPAHLDTGYTINLLRGLIIAAILFIFAEPIAAYVNEPKLADVLRVICIVLVFDGFKNPAFMMYRRNIDFSKEFTRSAASTIIGAIAAIAGAILTHSYWAIVIGTLVARFIELLFSYWRIPYRPGFGMSKWREFLGFGSWMTLDAILAYITVSAPQFLIGKYLGAVPLGYYTIGRDVSQVATHELAAPLTQAMFPGLAALAQHPERLRDAFRKAQSAVLGIALPIGFGSALMANELITIMVGAKWLPIAADVVVILAPALALAMTGSSINGLAMAKLELRAMLSRAIFVAVISLPVLFWAVQQGDLKIVLYAVVFRILLQAVTSIYFAKQLLNDSFFAAFLLGWRSLLAVGVMTVAVMLVPAPFEAGQNEFVVLVGMMPRVVLGAVIYIGVHLLLWKLAGKPDGLETKAIEILASARAKITARFAR